MLSKREPFVWDSVSFCVFLTPSILCIFIRSTCVVVWKNVDLFKIVIVKGNISVYVVLQFAIILYSEYNNTVIKLLLFH